MSGLVLVNVIVQIDIKQLVQGDRGVSGHQLGAVPLHWETGFDADA
jgi:hypothetical protein